jgi:hypothetical protein
MSGDMIDEHIHEIKEYRTDKAIILVSNQRTSCPGMRSMFLPKLSPSTQTNARDGLWKHRPRMDLKEPDHPQLPKVLH